MHGLAEHSSFNSLNMPHDTEQYPPNTLAHTNPGMTRCHSHRPWTLGTSHKITSMRSNDPRIGELALNEQKCHSVRTSETQRHTGGRSQRESGSAGLVRAVGWMHWQPVEETKREIAQPDARNAIASDNGRTHTCGRQRHRTRGESC